MPYYEEDLIKEIRERNDIYDIISQFVTLQKAGSNYKGLCPFHNEKTPSMIVSTEKQIFRCFGCGESGDVITFLSKIKNLNFNEAIEELAQLANIEIKPSESKSITKEANIIYEINRASAIYFYRCLKSRSKPLNYLKHRGIDQNIIKEFGIGYSLDRWDGLIKYLESKYKKEDIEKAGLISKNKKGNYYDRFRDRIIFPIWDIKSNIIGFGGRIIESSEKKPKYLNSPETEVFKKGNNLYGFNKLKNRIRGRQIIIVEGYMDVIALYKEKIDNCVAGLGTAITSEQIRVIKRYTDDIVIMYDSDEAGRKATLRAIEICKKEGIKPKIVILEEGLDPDDYLEKYGKELLLKKIKEAYHHVEYIIQTYRKNYNLNNIEDKIRYSKQVVDTLREIDDKVELEIFLNKISKELEIEKETLKKEISKKRKIIDIKENTKFERIEKKTENNLDSIVEIAFLKLALIRQDKITDMSIEIEDIDFLDESNKAIYQVFVKKDRTINEIELDKEKILYRFQEVENIKLYLDEHDYDKALFDYAKKIKLEGLKRKKKIISKRIKELDNHDDTEKQLLENLCRELIDIDKDIKKNKSR